MQLQFILLILAATFSQPNFAMPPLEEFEALKTKIQNEFGEEASLRTPMEYLVYGDVIRQQYFPSSQRPTFLVDTTPNQIYDINTIMTRVSSVTEVPHATIEIKDNEGVAEFKEKLAAVLPIPEQRFHVAITLPGKLGPSGIALLAAIEKDLSSNTFEFQGKTISLQNIDFVFYISIPQLKDKPKSEEYIKGALVHQLHLPRAFVLRMRKVFPLLEKGYKPTLAD